MNITELVGRAHDNAVKHGFWDPPLNFGTAIALIHSELSEALEEERAGRAPGLVQMHRRKRRRDNLQPEKVDRLRHGREGRSLSLPPQKARKAWPWNWRTL